ncbi:MAG: alpha-hydroxy acid oxidase [Chloroflexi bacterium]|nr:alpha-hydroxy acid oxidase [Chloroflexota bacterium]MDA1239705.1 alpha-hydroxy acid oxidase [Chloroflexota bacterium]MQC47835.1 alpha-hydroxy-acid oxidizing protein [Chloroflexota bacterium]
MTSTTPNLDNLINLAEIEAAAQTALAPMVRDYYAAGAMDEITLRDNREAFDRIAIRYHVLGGTSERDLSTQILGRKHDWPVLIAPTAFARLAHPDGEIGVARAASAAGVTQVLSTLSTTSLEDVARAVPDGARWFQLYVFRDRGLTADLVRRAEAAGYEAIVMTVDTPILGRRERDARNRFSLPEGLNAANLNAAMSRVASDGGDSGLFQFFARMVDPGLTWDDLEWLCSLTTLPVLVKGVVRGDDAERAITHGAAGVIVSNHGGRQLDTAISSIDALADVAEAVDGRGAVLMDGGIRRGTDIVKALASGASAVLIGRPALWGLAVGGEAGVARVLAILRDEFDLAMALCGARNVEDLWPDLLV